jgi:hypothetical protein
MRVIGTVEGTAVIDLLSMTQELQDDESWGELIIGDYAKGKRGHAPRTTEVKGGLI